MREDEWTSQWKVGNGSAESYVSVSIPGAALRHGEEWKISGGGEAEGGRCEEVQPEEEAQGQSRYVHTRDDIQSLQNGWRQRPTVCLALRSVAYPCHDAQNCHLTWTIADSGHSLCVLPKICELCHHSSLVEDRHCGHRYCRVSDTVVTRCRFEKRRSDRTRAKEMIRY